jgi:ADP-heptose:LPS heptosyltransferase
MTGIGLHWGAADHILPIAATGPNTSTIYADKIQTPFAQVYDLELLTRKSFDWVLCGERILTEEKPLERLQELISKLRQGGHLIFAIPQETSATFNYIQFEDMLRKIGSWCIKDYQTKVGVVLVIAKLIPGFGKIEYLKPPTRKRACIIRYGAIGDLIMVTPLIRALHEDGYDVTMNVSTYSKDAITNNPYVSNIIPHERNVVDNQELGAYWATWAQEYDKYINLSESIEGSLLKIEARRDFYTPKAFREATCSEGYLDKTMRIAGYPDAPKRQELFFSKSEEAWRDKFLKPYKDKFTIGWGLNGSSAHKRYAILEPTLRSWLEDKEDAQVFLLGNEAARPLTFEHPQVRSLISEISLRELFCMLEKLNVVVGPESAIINAAACWTNPKIVLLSHSSESNLCSNWTNYVALKPDAAIAPCYPCHQMHNSADTCPLVQIETDTLPEVLRTGPACAMGAISAEAVHAALDIAYSAWKNRMI